MILNCQREVRVSIKSLGKFLGRAQSRLRLSQDSLTVALVSNSAIARWNRSYRGKNRPTDVLSFPVQSDSPKRPAKRTAKRPKAAPRSGEDQYLGDIAIAPAVARANAARFGRTFETEMRILILHGILHLMGYDHETDTGQMERRERLLRRDLGLA
ncbi:MAG: rRNA maturation RNase YbeY [Candidatus Acidiferrales bacterium]